MEKIQRYQFRYEIVLYIWYCGLFLSQATNPGTKGGLSWVKYLQVVLGICAAMVHMGTMFMSQEW